MKVSRLIGAGLPVPELIVLGSAFRFILRPIVDYIVQLEANHPERTVAVLVPEFVENRWCYNLIHNNRSAILKALLLIQGTRHTAVVNIPWYLSE
jgi:hypothetical protein